eukprot:CCRYP_013867-RC/>CCRYP_013867-RC protein AED:0.46 eAED:1.00 QI:0/0/0/1/0/0/2/0/117
MGSPEDNGSNVKRRPVPGKNIIIKNSNIDRGVNRNRNLVVDCIDCLEDVENEKTEKIRFVVVIETSVEVVSGDSVVVVAFDVVASVVVSGPSVVSGAYVVSVPFVGNEAEVVKEVVC